MQKIVTLSKIRSIKTFGNSMTPLLHDGDVVYIKKISFKKMKVNDIICVQKRGKFFTHRVIYHSLKYLITRGDSNFISDGKIYPKNVIGLVYKVKRDKHIFSINYLYLIQSSNYLLAIKKVKKELNSAKIEFVFPRGLPLYMYFDGTYPRRVYVDSDILVNVNEIDNVKKILIKLGYQEIDTSFSKIQKKIKKKSSKTSFFKLVNGFPVVIDIHWEVGFMMTQLGKLDYLYSQNLMDDLTSKFIHERRWVEIQGEKFPILSQSNLIVYYLLHIYHHNFRGAYKFEFFNKIINVGGINYNEVAKIITNYRLKNFAYPSFMVLQKYYAKKFPGNFLDQIRPSKSIVKLIHTEIINTNIFDEESRIGSGVTRFKNRFRLSPNSIWVKSRVFLDTQVLYAVFWVIKSKFKNYISTLKLSF